MRLVEIKSWFDIMQVCENGHKITGVGIKRPEYLVERCSKCGALTMTQCTECGTDIRGYKHIPNVASADRTEPPDFCIKCGKAFPWTDNKRISEEAPSDLPIDSLLEMLNRFHLVVKQLRNRPRDRTPLEIVDEYDVQYLMHAMLKLKFSDVRPEEWTPSYAGSSSRMDFLLKDEGIVVETKKTRDGLRDKQVGEELLIDIAKYKNHPDCEILVCFIYDPEEIISNSEGLKHDLEQESSDDLNVVVHISP